MRNRAYGVGAVTVGDAPVLARCLPTAIVDKARPLVVEGMSASPLSNGTNTAVESDAHLPSP
jgi:hypothetical protein